MRQGEAKDRSLTLGALDMYPTALPLDQFNTQVKAQSGPGLAAGAHGRGLLVQPR